MDKIICLGKNYAEHAKELGESVPEKPVVFLKPPSVLREAKMGTPLPLRIPKDAGLLHHECEIVVRLSAGGYRLSEAQAEKSIGAVTLGLDMTLRDLQTQLKKQGHPWTPSKVFLDSAVIGPWIPLQDFRDYLEQPFSLKVNDELRQTARGKEMIFGPAASIAYLSTLFPLEEGDLVFTGTPQGINSILPGQTAVLEWGRLSYTVRWSLF